MSPLDLSFRYKIPLWGSVIVVVTALAVSAVLMERAYEEMEEDLLTGTATLADALVPNVFYAMLRDNLWRVYELINTPLEKRRSGLGLPGKIENIVVVDSADRVYVAARPRLARIGTPVQDLGAGFAAVVDRKHATSSARQEVITVPDGTRLMFMVPIAEEGAHLGAMIFVLSRAGFTPRFVEVVRYGLWAGAVLLCILLPLNWYWGWRMARPLTELADRMKGLGNRLPAPLDPGLYGHDDEIGSLFQSYNRMLGALKEKVALEQQVVQADRLAALGQLAAGVAHEINNPLGGMLVAIDTLKSQGTGDARTAKTIALLERGLEQIRETVGALLVEARLKSRHLSESDIEDVLVLVLPQVHKKGLHLDWHNALAGEAPLPATLVRQVLINLLLNAVHAADKDGRVGCRVEIEDRTLKVAVANDGKLLSPEQMAHLFEPFSPLSAEGHGLGLWVTYQIVRQLGGKIAASQEDGRMLFMAELPLGGNDG